MKKIFKLSLIIIMLFVFACSLSFNLYKPLLASSIPTTNISENDLSKLENVSKVYEGLLKSAQNEPVDLLMKGMIENSKIFDSLIRGKSVVVNNPQGNNPLITPNWYKYIPISGYIPPHSQRNYGSYSNADWISVSFNYWPKYMITLYIHDETNNTIVASVTTANGSITLSSNLNPSHAYGVHIFNASNVDVSYSGQITLSIK